MALLSQRTVYASGPIAGIRSYRNGRGTPQDHLKQQRELFIRDQSLFSHPTSPFLGTADITVTFLPPTSFLGTADVTVIFLPSSNLFSRNCRHNSYHLPMGWRSWQYDNLTAAEWPNVEKAAPVGVHSEVVDQAHSRQWCC